MPRTPRNEQPGLHHVTARGNNREPIFSDDDDRAAYLALFHQAIARHRWRCLVYCLMTNHVHFLIETEEVNLGVGMRRFHSVFVQYRNKRHGRSGHAFEKRYHSERVETEEHLGNAVGYIAVNPVHAGICDRADDWPWSSHRAIVDGTDDLAALPDSWEAIIATERAEAIARLQLDPRRPPLVDRPRLFELLDAWTGNPLRTYVRLVEGRTALLRPGGDGELSVP